jgi:hypothetical protein
MFYACHSSYPQILYTVVYSHASQPVLTQEILNKLQNLEEQLRVHSM